MPPIRLLVLMTISLIIFNVSPNFAQAPIQENTYSFTVVNGIAVSAVSISHISPKTIALASFSYGSIANLTPIIESVILCESGGRHEGVWGDNGKAYGIAQFWEKTFYWFADMAGLENPDWYNKEQQLYLLEWGLRNGYAHHWTCWQKL